MATQPTPDATRRALATAGVGTAALLLAAASALPAFAAGNGNAGNAGNAGSNGNHYGQSKDHTNNGHQSGSSQASPASQGQAAGSTSTGHNPPGNNGTVFIHDVAGDHSPHNVPHVSCTFYVDLFGFDANQPGTVSFAGQAPTGKGVALGGTWTGTMSTDDAGGAGNDFDTELTFTADQLGVSSLGAPAHQGYHVKMTVVTNQPGDHKYKVFWLQPCAQTAATTTTQSPQSPQSSSATGTQPTSTEVKANGGQSSNAATTQTTQSANSPASSNIPTEVLGRTITRGANSPAAAPAASSLPFTGAEISGLAAAAAIALGGGAALTVAGRRRRHARSVSR